MMRTVFLSSAFFLSLNPHLVGSGLSDLQGQEWVKDNFNGQLVKSPNDTWAVVKRWLKTFGPGNLVIEAETEMYRFGKVIS